MSMFKIQRENNRFSIQKQNDFSYNKYNKQEPQ